MYQPLADLLRPQTLDEVYGQEHILGQGAIMPGALALSSALSVVVLVLGVMIFNKVEKTFMDTV